MHVARAVLFSVTSVAQLSNCITVEQNKDNFSMVDSDEAMGLFAVLSGE